MDDRKVKILEFEKFEIIFEEVREDGIKILNLFIFVFFICVVVFVICLFSFISSFLEV